MTGRRWVLAGSLTAVLALAGAGALGDDTPEQLVTRLQDSLLELMRTGDDSYTQRVELIAPVVNETLDLETISRLVLGRHWRALEPAQRTLFVERFRELSVSTYASHFDTYNDERFELGDPEPPGGGRVRIQSLLVPGDAPPIPFEYQLQHTESGWRIINIIVDGVSDLALKRAEYNAILTDDNFEALLRALDEQIEHNRSRGS